MSNKVVTVQEKIKIAQQHKEEGNLHFKNQDWKQALISYHKVFLYINGLISQDEDFNDFSSVQLTTQEETNAIRQLSCLTYGNMAQVYINQQKYDKGKEAAQNSLRINNNIKVLYRLAICNIELNNLEEAKSQLNEVKKMDKKIDISPQLKQIEEYETRSEKALAQAMKKLYV